MSREKTEATRFGVRPPLETVDKLPTPEEVFNIPHITTGKMITKILGPAMIALGMSIGSGEWLMGPSVAALYGMGLFWLVLIGGFTQTIFNMAWGRVTLWSGEPPVIWFSRAPPGPKFWGWWIPLWVVLAKMWPGWAVAAATGLGAIMLGRVPGLIPAVAAADTNFIRMLGIVLFLACFAIVMFGYKIERTLEIANWVQVIFILAALIFFVAPLTITGEAVSETARGIVSFGYIPKGVDILLLGGWWAYIGYASGSNFDWGNYYRDKGYAMGQTVGYIPAMVGGKKVPVSPLGKTFKLTSENLATWRKWYKILVYDQWFIFFVGAMIGMFLPSLIVRSLLPPGTKLPAWGIAAHISTAFAAKVGPWGFGFICFIGFLILFTTQFGVIDVLARNVTDCSWSLSDKVRGWTKGDIRKLYYLIFILYMLFGCWAMYQTQPLILLLLGANASNLTGIFSVPLVIWGNRQLPKEIAPPAWEYVILVIFWIICVFFSVAILLAQLGIKIL